MQINIPYDYVIGIDSGTKTGFAVYCRKGKFFDTIASLNIHNALFKVKAYHDAGEKILVVVEDARKATHGRNTQTDRNKLQGAGSIKRDAVIWEDFLKEFNIPHVMSRPNKSITKLSAKVFKQTTGYTGVTSEHSRDAAMIALVNA